MRDRLLNGGAYCRTVRQLGNTTAETEQDGAWVDRVDPNNHGMAMSGKLVINYSATLLDGGTLTLANQFQDATAIDGTGAADYGDAVAATTIDTGDSGGEDVTGTIEIDVDLSGANQFIRSQPTVVASGAGTVAYSASLVLFGDQRNPSTKAIATIGGAPAA